MVATRPSGTINWCPTSPVPFAAKYPFMAASPICMTLAKMGWSSGVMKRGTPPPLIRIHADETFESGLARLSYVSWRKQSTSVIVDSLKPGNIDALKVKSDGRIIDGNTRIRVLEERGYDTNSLPREYY